MSDCPCGMAREACEYHRETGDILTLKSDAGDDTYECRVTGYYHIGQESIGSRPAKSGRATPSLAIDTGATDPASAMGKRPDLAAAAATFRTAKAQYESIRMRTSDHAKELRQLQDIEVKAYDLALQAQTELVEAFRAEYNLGIDIPSKYR